MARFGGACTNALRPAPDAPIPIPFVILGFPEGKDTKTQPLRAVSRAPVAIAAALRSSLLDPRDKPEEDDGGMTQG
jgi:hypothetical protein